MCWHPNTALPQDQWIVQLFKGWAGRRASWTWKIAPFPRVTFNWLITIYPGWMHLDRCCECEQSSQWPIQVSQIRLYHYCIWRQCELHQSSPLVYCTVIWNSLVREREAMARIFFPRSCAACSVVSKCLEPSWLSSNCKALCLKALLVHSPTS